MLSELVTDFATLHQGIQAALAQAIKFTGTSCHDFMNVGLVTSIEEDDIAR